MEGKDFGAGVEVRLFWYTPSDTEVRQLRNDDGIVVLLQDRIL